MVSGIEHIAVCSKNTEALKDWYIKIFGMREVYNNGKGTYFVAAPDGSMIEIISAKEDVGTPDMADTGIRHFALSVSLENFEILVQKIKNEGVEVLAEPAEKNGIKTFFFRDIDKNVFHLIYRPNSLV